MKNYKYIYAIGFSALGAAIGYFIGWLLVFIFSFLFDLVGLDSFSGGGILAVIGFVLGLLPMALFYALIIIGAIRGWKYGYKIGKKKETESKK